MIGHDQVGVVADEQPALHFDLQAFELADFDEEGDGIDDDPVADQAVDVGVEDPRGDQVEDVLLLADVHRVAGVGPALVARDDVDLLAEMVDDFSLTLVAPLGADNDRDWHNEQDGTRPPAQGRDDVAACGVSG